MIDMQTWMTQLDAAMKKKQLNVIAQAAARMEAALAAEESRPGTLMPEYKRNQISKVREALGVLVRTASPADADDKLVFLALSNMKKLFYPLFASTVIYLIRHTEKAGGEEAKAGYVLKPVVGPQQAHAYAQMLIDEIRLCPHDVKVTIFHSEVSRTAKFAQLVAYELDKLAKNGGRTVKFDIKGQDMRIGMRYTNEQLDAMNKTATARGVKADGGWAQFSDYYANPGVYAQEAPGKLPIPGTIVAEIDDFVQNERKNHPSTPDTWNIVLGFSHSWILDCYRVRYAGGNAKAIISTAGYLKIDGWEINIDGRWYPYPFD